MASKQDIPETPPKGVRKNLFHAGLGRSPGDLISSILEDHEQSKVAAAAMVGMPDGAVEGRSLSGVDEQTARSERELLSQAQRRRSESDIIKKSHWANAAQASKCADCRKRFTSILDRRRNCHKCGKVFCRHCTNYQKKLSAIAEPDPLGKFYHVCHKCFDDTTVAGQEKDLMRDFSSFRRELKELKRKQVEKEELQPLCARRGSDAKRIAYGEETKRLVEGFTTNVGMVNGFISEFATPSWQKSALWVPSSKVNGCFGCKTGFGFSSRKIHCRICGQVFCTACTAEEVIIYRTESGMVQWAVNGKPGCPTTQPKQYENLRICNVCSVELQALKTSFEPQTPARRDFSDNIYSIHVNLSSLLANVDAWLPEYHNIVESLDATDGSPHSIEGRNPMHALVKSQSNLSDAFTQMAIESQKLKAIKPQTDIQDKLLRHVMIGTYQYYSENMFVFRNTKNRLMELMPLEHLEQIQLILSQQSMERIHVIVRQMLFECMRLEAHYKFDNSFYKYIIDVERNFDQEFRVFLEEQDESWDRHVHCCKAIVEQDIKSEKTRKIKVDKSLAQMSPKKVHYVVVSQCSSLVHECYRDLQAKTIEREFPKTKASLNNARKLLDEILVGFNLDLDQSFSTFTMC